MCCDHVCVVKKKRKKIFHSSSEKWQNCQFKEVKPDGSKMMVDWL